MNQIKTRKALNPAYRKHKPKRSDVNQFVESLKTCIDSIKLSDANNESEEHLKEPIKQFLQNTFYKENLINTKDRIDLAIYLGKDAKSDLGVLIEAKRPSNKNEFIRVDNLNKKALQELLLYYLRERLDNKNNNIKHLIATNGFEWFLFKAEDFYNLFFKNKKLIKEYEAFRDGLKDTTKNELFYNEIASPFIEEVQNELPFVYLDFTKTPFDTLKDEHLNTLYKIFSDVHILGHSFGNDSNQLNKAFYNELLHIIGLEEVTNKGKKLIQRKDEKNRDYASLLENTIFTLEEQNHLPNVKSIPNGEDKPFNVGLELCLTWINRILFLKLLESQLLSYHKGAKEYQFLNSDFIGGFDELNTLFFSALAKKHDERHPKYKERFQYIPYLNSSLFERNTLENEAFAISSVQDDQMHVYTSTVLKDANGKRLKGKLSTLDYLFKFLDAYDFATDGTEGIEDAEDTKTLINASVLGLIFEKINGYKEGSFYTPAYITMYMCKETLRRAVVQKFKEHENDQIETFDDLQAYCRRFFKKEDTKRFNTLINTLRICDPAVGSGHFLVSALNELIVIKNELGILVDHESLPLRCDIQIENDELYISDANGKLLEYDPKDVESSRIQRALFHEKQTLIENCLFGVDINPNSVKICRLRLWIELLKNAYYTQENKLHTLPNIDINIKCGNSLISRFDLKDDLQDAFKGKEVNYDFDDYRNAVAEYKETNDKNRKREVLQIIEEVKNNFKSTLDNKFLEKFQKAQGKYINEEQRLNNLKLLGEKIKKVEKDNLKKLKLKAEKAYDEKEEIVNNAIYHNAFEWRFEFPEILDKQGNFIGFDVVIGNPPYLRPRNLKKEAIKYYKTFKTYENQFDLYHLFIEKSYNITNSNNYSSYIVPNTFLANENNKNLRKFILDNFNIDSIIDSRQKVFEDADVDVLIFIFGKKNNFYYELNNQKIKFKHIFNADSFKSNVNFNFSLTLNEKSQKILQKIEFNSLKVNELFEVNSGIKEYQKGKGKPPQTDFDKTNRVFNSNHKVNELFRPQLRGKNINRYIVNWKNEYIKYGEWLAEPRNPKFFEGERLLIRKIPAKDNLVLTFTDENFIIDQSIYIGLPISNDYNILYSLSCLNSKIEWWYFKNLYNEFDNLFPQIKTREFKNLCIPKCNLKSQQPFIDKVNQILEAKKENPEADTTVLEAEIDLMVYKLYELTHEEVLIVDPEFSMSERDYNEFKINNAHAIS